MTPIASKTVQFCLENPVWTIERLLSNRSHHWFDEFGEGLFTAVDRINLLGNNPKDPVIFIWVLSPPANFLYL